MQPVPPSNHHAPLRVAEDTWLIRQLQGEGEAPVAIYINSLVIKGKEPVIVDTGTVNNREHWLQDVGSLVDLEDVRWIFLSHDDHDHVGNLGQVLEACPKATLVTNWFSMERLATDIPLPFDRARWVNSGEFFNAGDRNLVAMTPPLFDSPTTRGLFDTHTGVYWAVDSFAAPVLEPVDDVAELDPAFWAESLSMGNRLNSPWHQWLDAAKWGAHVRNVRSLGIRTIASAHSAPIHGPLVDTAFDLLLPLAGAAPAPLPGQPDLEAIIAAGSLGVPEAA
jgi:flavorubredoxin